METLGYHLTITDDAKNFIAEKGYDIQFGARFLFLAIHTDDFCSFERKIAFAFIRKAKKS